MYWAPTRLGYARTFGAYAWRSLLNTGVIVPNGSDFPVERVNPLYSFHAAVSRQDDDNWPPGGWFPEQKMTRDEALKSMTIWPAFAGFPGTVDRLADAGQIRRFCDPGPGHHDRSGIRYSRHRVCSATYIGGRAVFERSR